MSLVGPVFGQKPITPWQLEELIADVISRVRCPPGKVPRSVILSTEVQVKSLLEMLVARKDLDQAFFWLTPVVTCEGAGDPVDLRFIIDHKDRPALQRAGYDLDEDGHITFEPTQLQCAHDAARRLGRR